MVPAAMLFFLTVIVLVIYYLITIRKKNQKFVKLSTQLKCGIRSLPFLGHSYLMIGSDEYQMKNIQYLGKDAINHGGTTGLWLASNLYIMIADPEVAEIVLKTNLEKDDLVKFFHPVVGDGSIFAPVSIWRPRRKFLAPTFSQKNLNKFVNIFSEKSQITAARLQSEVGNESTSLLCYLSGYSLDAVYETLLGIEMQAQTVPDQPLLLALDKLFQLVAARVCQPWLHSDALYTRLPRFKKVAKYRKLIYDLVDKIIFDTKRKKKEDHQNGNTERGKTFIELMVNSIPEVSSVAIREECIVMMGAGIDTSATAMCYVAVMLSLYQDVQEKVAKELKEVFGKSDRAVTSEDLPQLKYLEAVIKETLRLYPPVPVIIRKIETEIELPSGVKLVPGCGAFINIWAIHRNPAYWTDPDKFIPERFLTDSKTFAASYISFSYGPRACLGYQYAIMFIKTTIANLVRKYHFLPIHKLPLRVKFNVMMRHVDNYCVKIVPRT